MEVKAEVGEGASGRRRYWTAEEKRRIVELTISSSQSVASLARQHGVNANQVFYCSRSGNSMVDGSGVCEGRLLCYFCGVGHRSEFSQ